MLSVIRPCPYLRLRRFFCRLARAEAGAGGGAAPDLAMYKEVFARRMAMAGIKPHHRIALGVSGGPDSMALCVLSAGWKLDSSVSGRDEATGFIDGLLGIVVDHRLRAESADEAVLVRDRVQNMGIRCEIVNCDWPGGRPKLGHLQESAREMRYKMLQGVCMEQQTCILLIAHHADDQAELLILRLSRNSGVLGLAGMPFVSQLFPQYLSCEKDSCYDSILLVRPLMEFSKHEMYKICQGGHQQWVEDPTNQSPLFARNRIRLSLRSSSSSFLTMELQRFLSACRLTRSYVENTCHLMIEHTVEITEHGYAIIDLEKLKPSSVDDICLSRYLVLLMQYISQRHRPVRGSALHLLLDYIRKIPCKDSITAAGCYLSAAPRSKGMKIIICYSTVSPQSSRTVLSYKHSSLEQRSTVSSELHQIIMDAKSHSYKAMQEKDDVPFLRSRLSIDILNEAKKLNLISESTLKLISLLKNEEHEKFRIQTEVQTEHTLGAEFLNTSNAILHPGKSCHFMSRFIVTWNEYGDDKRGFSLDGDQIHLFQFCMTNHEKTAAIRHMVDADWLYLAKLSESQVSQGTQGHPDVSPGEVQRSVQQKYASSYLQMQAQNALKVLKFIPVHARRGMPVLVSSKGLLLSIPGISFRCCPCLSVGSVFKPRVPLGGGYSSYI